MSGMILPAAVHMVKRMGETAVCVEGPEYGGEKIKFWDFFMMGYNQEHGCIYIKAKTTDSFGRIRIDRVFHIGEGEAAFSKKTEVEDGIRVTLTTGIIVDSIHDDELGHDETFALPVVGWGVCKDGTAEEDFAEKYDLGRDPD